MSCCRQDNTAESRKVLLKFKRAELLYDIRNYAYVEGEVLGDENQHAHHTLVEVGEQGNVDRVTRILAVVHAAVVELLYPFTKQEPVEEEIDNMLWSPEEYHIEVTVPVTFSRTSLHLLSKLIHEYMVYRVMYDWLCITNPEKAGHWLEKAKAVEEQIEDTKNMRTGVLTRKCSPW